MELPRRLLPDSRLAKLAARGDARAFEAIFTRHHRELYGYCRTLLGDPDDAQDALQGAMAAALRALPGERREIAIRPWLFRVAHNEAISILRRRNGDAPPEETPLSAPGADAALEDRERLRDLVADLTALPERQRGALVMRELSGLSYAEIGEALEASEQGARQIVYEAREAMREAKLARDADCAEIRELISARDGRVLRGRRVRAHMRACTGCADFRTGISTRRADLGALAPPLPPAAATGLIASALGKTGTAGVAAGVGSTGAGGLAGIGTLATGISAVSKGGAIAAAVVLGAGAVGATGAVDLPIFESSQKAPAAAAPAIPDRQADPAARARSRPASGSAGAAAGNQRGSSGGGQAIERNGRPDSGGQGAGGSQGDGTGAHTQRPQGPPQPAETATPPSHAPAGARPSAGTGTGNAGGGSTASNGVAADPPRSVAGGESTSALGVEVPAPASGRGAPAE